MGRPSVVRTSSRTWARYTMYHALSPLLFFTCCSVRGASSRVLTSHPPKPKIRVRGLRTSHASRWAMPWTFCTREGCMPMRRSSACRGVRSAGPAWFAMMSPFCGGGCGVGPPRGGWGRPVGGSAEVGVRHPVAVRAVAGVDGVLGVDLLQLLPGGGAGEEVEALLAVLAGDFGPEAGEVGDGHAVADVADHGVSGDVTEGAGVGLGDGGGHRCPFLVGGGFPPPVVYPHNSVYFGGTQLDHESIMSTQNREEPAVTTDKPVTTSKYSIRLLDPLVEVFDDIAARLDTTRTARIEQHMLSDVRLHGTPDEIA